MNKDLKSLLDFVAFTHDVRQIKRDIWVKDEEQFENDSEHSFQLAMVSLYLIEENKLTLDPLKTMAMAMVHDILEVHAGDTPVFGNTDLLESKKERELKAIKKLEGQWPNMKLMLQLIDEYEQQLSKESKFIYALDKLLPVLNNYLDNGRTWKHKKISLDDIILAKQSKVGIDPVVKDYFDQIINILKQKSELFN